MKISKVELKKKVLAEAAKGRYFTVSFIKKSTGKPRTMRCRLKQFDQYTGGKRSWNPEESNRLFVIDKEKVDAKLPANRTIDFNTIFEANLDGQKFTTI